MSTLKEIPHEGFSPAARCRLAGGNKRFPFRLPYSRRDIVNEQVRQARHMSISGVQDKISLRLCDGELVPAEKDGEYILKPIPSAVIPAFREDIPANEHLTMQIAGQVFGISTAVNALVFLKDGEPAYLTRRFDRHGGVKIPQEDFCQLGGRAEGTHGKDYKYNCSCEELGRILRRFCPAYQVEVEKLFALLLFNYVFSNGDAHLKNFSLFMSENSDHVLTPAYDLLCTSMHFSEESRTALDMFDSYESRFFRDNGFYWAEDFLKLAEIFGIKSIRAERLVSRCALSRDKTEAIVARSFLSETGKNEYLRQFNDRLSAIC
ncbi:MAG: HipA domain-containing protein [Victivallales bacterium]|nr:HipA domain-containing protein [Victivallales bacterium]